MSPADVRTNLFAVFRVVEQRRLFRPNLYIAHCRTCGQVVARVPQASEAISAAPILAALRHCQLHGPPR